MKTPLPFRVLSKIAALSLAAAFSLPASAQSAGDNIVNVGWFHLYTDDSSEPLRSVPGNVATPGSGASVGSADTVGIAFTHFFTDNFAVVLDAGVPPEFKLKGEGSLASLGQLGTAKQWSPAIVAKWYFGGANDKWRPFAGLGATRVWYSDVVLSRSLQTQVAGASGSGTAELSSSWAPVANVGVTYNIDKNWSIAASLSYIPLETHALITGRSAGGTVVSRNQTTLTLDPYVSFISVGYKF